MKYQEAKEIADKYLQLLSPYCERIAIAGSLRREKPIVKDIELVVIPLKVDDPHAFFYDQKVVHPKFVAIVNSLQKVKGEPRGKYTQRILPEGIKLDLFICEPGNWAPIYLIRTGDWEFSKKFMGTILPKNGYKQINGWVHKNGNPITIKEEKELFKLMNITYIKPKKRKGNSI